MSGELASKTILLVEDEALIALNEERVLSSLGYSVVRAHSGERALEIALETPQVDLVLMDIDLGDGMDGTEVAKKILRDREIPIVFLTSHSEKSMVEKVKDITRYGYVLKSSGKFVLAETIEMALNLFDSRRRLEDENRHHRQTREILAEKTIFLESTFEAIQDGISVLDVDLTVSHVNGVMEEWYAPNLPLEGKKCYEVYHNRQRPCDNCPTLRSIRTGNVERSVVPGSPDSAVKWVELFAFPMKDGVSEEVTGVVEYVRDITDREEKSERLRESERRSEERRHYLEAILSAAPVAVVTLNSENRVIEWNDAARELFGYSAEEAQGSNIDELVSGRRQEARAEAMEHSRRVLGGERVEQQETVRYRKDGSPVDVVISAVSIQLNGSVTGAIATYKDTGRRKAAERALESERDEVRQLLERQNILIQEVHHRIKNDMSFVRSLLSLQAHQSKSNEVARSLGEASNRVAVMSHVYERMYLDSDFRSVDVANLVEGLVKDLQSSTIPATISLTVEAEPLSIPTRQSLSLGIILNELLTNSVKYAFSEIGEPWIGVSVTGEEAGTLNLTVRDNGRGIPDGVIQGEPRGYGLTVVAALVEQHEGTVTIRNEQGGVVEVTLSC